MSERFYVVTTQGYRTVTGHSKGHGVSALVLDRAVAHRVIRLFRSEDMADSQGRAACHAQAVAKAEAEAARLNGLEVAA